MKFLKHVTVFLALITKPEQYRQIITIHSSSHSNLKVSTENIKKFVAVGR